MPRIIYPENRTVTVEWVITKAHDMLLDEEFERRGGTSVWASDVAKPDYETARKMLEEAGHVTFSGDDY